MIQIIAIKHQSIISINIFKNSTFLFAWKIWSCFCKIEKNEVCLSRWSHVTRIYFSLSIPYNYFVAMVIFFSHDFILVMKHLGYLISLCSAWISNSWAKQWDTVKGSLQNGRRKFEIFNWTQNRIRFSDYASHYS